MASRDSKLAPVTIGCKGSDAIGATVSAVHIFVADRNVAKESAAKLSIIVEELVTNLVEHGDIGEAGEIELVLRLGEHIIHIELADTGTAFDPRNAGSSETVPERGGGAGIAMVRAWAKMTDYRSADGWNRLFVQLAI